MNISHGEGEKKNKGMSSWCEEGDIGVGERVWCMFICTLKKHVDAAVFFFFTFQIT